MANTYHRIIDFELYFQSVMHYSSKNFAADGVGPTMTKKVRGIDSGMPIKGGALSS